jgi:hypothetical protein
VLTHCALTGSQLTIACSGVVVVAAAAAGDACEGGWIHDSGWFNVYQASIVECLAHHGRERRLNDGFDCNDESGNAVSHRTVSRN